MWLEDFKNQGKPVWVLDSQAGALAGPASPPKVWTRAAALSVSPHTVEKRELEKAEREGAGLDPPW